jgi:hypothetical protein
MVEEVRKRNRGWSSPLVRAVTFGLLGVGAVATCGIVMARLQPPAVKPVSSSRDGDKIPSNELKTLAGKYFRNWPAGRAPDAVVILTGEQHNFEAPCGCSSPQLGGLERRYNFIKLLRDQGLEVVAADLGDVYYSEYVKDRPTQQDQLKLKFAKSYEALNLMKYSAVGVGVQEFRYGLLDALGATVLGKENSFSVLAANLKDRDANFPDVKGSMVGDWTMAGKSVKVAFAGIIGKSVEAKIRAIDKTVAFADNNIKIVEDLESAMGSQKPDVRVMLYQGDEKDAKVLAERFKSFDVILCLSPESDPPIPATVGNTKIVGVGHKGRHVGVVGAFRKDGGWDLKYDVVPLGPEFQTAKEERVRNAMNQILEKYTEEVRDKKLIDRYPRADHTLQVTFAAANPAFVGSDKCKDCHAKEYAVWEASKHAEAFEALDDARLTQAPKNRKTDGECVVCHTTGFGYKTGYKNEQSTPALKGVGCESCHGPGSAHISKPKDKALNLAMSPWKVNAKDALPATEVTIDTKLCFRCHDTDNDPHFKFDFWRKIAHGPNEKASKAYYEAEYKKRLEKDNTKP